MFNQRPRHSLAGRAGIRRREVLAALLAGGTLASWKLPLDARMRTGISPRDGESAFPEGIEVYEELYENWTRELSVPGMRTFAPQSPQDVVNASNWAAQNGARLRARGMRHNWSPLTVSAQTTTQTSMLIADTTQHLTRVELTSYAGLPAVRAETGVLLEDLLEFVEQGGYGFTAVTAVGAVTLGGVLAINGHGAAVPARGEAPLPQQTYGSLSNRVLEVTAVVWSKSEARFVLRRFDRSAPEMAALLVHLGRTFITEVVMALEPNQNLRCLSHVDIPATEMFGAPGAGGRSIERFLDSAGRIESIWYPFTENPWLKVWSVSPQKPLTSRAVDGPYNYPFSDNIPDEMVALIQEMMNGKPEMAPLFGQTTYAVTAAGLAATASLDLWGPSKNTLLFIKATTVRVHEFSWAVLTRREHVQQILHDHSREFTRRLYAAADAGQYPVNMPVEYRVTGLDQAADSGVGDAQTAALSAMRPDPARPELDTIVFLSVLSIPGTPGMFSFFRELEQWMLGHYRGELGEMRPEWSKGWAYSEAAAWAEPAILADTIPDAFGGGAEVKSWTKAFKILRALDPHGVFSNAFLDQLG